MNNLPMKDQEMMQDVLASQKAVTGVYNTFTNECVSPSLRDDFLNILREEHMIQADVFSEIQRRGWYNVTPAEQQKVQQTKQKFQNML